MARPQKQTVDYFPHDANAGASDTLTVLQGRWGNAGYAFWFRLMEKLASSEGHVIDCRNPLKWQLLLAKTQLTEETGEEIMKALADLEAIDPELWSGHRLIWCQDLVDNIADVYKNRRREIPQKPVITNKKAITTGDNAITTGRGTQSKVKKTKVNKSIYIPYPEFPNVNKMTRGEHRKLIDLFGEAGTKDRVENLSLYIASKGDKYKNHYATILAWNKRDRQRTGRIPTDPMESERLSLRGIRCKAKAKELGRDLSTKERQEIEDQIDEELEKKYGHKAL